MTLLAQLQRQGEGLRAIDLAFADTLHRLDPQTDDYVLAGAALASLAISVGHAAFDPAQPELLLGSTSDLPTVDAWLAALGASSWVDDNPLQQPASAAAPLVLEHGLLYLRRYREYERRLAAGLGRIAAHTPPFADLVKLTPLFAQLFPNAQDASDGGQGEAAAVALLRSLLLVVGGPGTGKTTVIAHVLLLLIAAAQHAGRTPPRIALAAPTGRAAERMAESLREALRRLPEMDASLLDALPEQARTLHRLLGPIPDQPNFRHHAGNPVPFEVIVVDEASMVDLPLMCKLVEAVPEGARLILLGDRDQLPSVEAGDVLAAMTEVAGMDDPLSLDTAAGLRCLLGTRSNAVATPATTVRPSSLLSGHCVHLRRSYRQSESLQLTALTTAVREGDASTTLTLLRANTLAGVQFYENLADPLTGATCETLLAPWRAVMRTASVDDPMTALAQATQMRLLTPLRDGIHGAIALNARIEEALAGVRREPYFHGRLLLINENSYRHGLFNGDIGICLRTDRHNTVAFFADKDGVRGFHPAALPAHGGAFAMTVHKAQGSEYDTVWLQLPQQDARPLSRELLYTAMTRARSNLHIAANETVLRAAIARHVRRISGLAQRLLTA